MDRVGVDRILCAPPNVGWPDAFSSGHDLIARAMKEFPDRIFGYARCIPERGEAAIEDLRRLVGDRGFRAVKINPLDGHYTLADRQWLDPVMDVTQEFGVPVLFHTGDMHGITCSPALVADLAVDFPGVTCIIGHVGVPGFLEEVVPVMKRVPNLVTETAGYFRPSGLQIVVEGVGAGRVLMGSNCPYMPLEFAVKMVAEHTGLLGSEQKDAILGGNLSRILKIE
jgi:predicted TIM-barrel fold metal-dependent hydrolase